MRNATRHQRKIRKLLTGLTKTAEEPPLVEDALAMLAEAILSADASEKQVADALEALRQEFVDINELRVAPPKEIAEVLGKDYPSPREKAQELVTVLNATFDRHNALSLRDLVGMPKRELRRRLTELGLSHFATGWLLLKAFAAHAVPVDQSLVDCLEMCGCIEAGSSIQEVQSLLERTVRQKEEAAAHEFFRSLVAQSSKTLARRRKTVAEAAAKAEAEAEAQTEAEAAVAEAEAGEGAQPPAPTEATPKAEAAGKAAAPRAAAPAPRPKAPARTPRPRTRKAGEGN